MHAGNLNRPQLGIDFGTSSTVAVLAVAGREPRPLLFDGSPVLPSAVCLDPTGQLLTGRDALHTAISTPAAFEPHPKLRIDDGTVLLAGTEVGVAELYRAVLDRVRTAARAVTADDADPQLTVTCPAGWGPVRRAVLADAAGPQTRLLDEPVAAAHHLAHIAGDRVPDGGRVLIYDFGAGTIDAAVVRRHGVEFRTEASNGTPDCGGLDIDAAIVARLRALGTAALWQRLDQPRSVGDRRARHQLWHNVRAAKEMLSRASTTLIHLPLLDVDVPLGREELDELAAPVIARTVGTVEQTLSAAGISATDLSAIFLCGGSSRMPAVATVLHRRFGIAPVTVEQPELAVAEGSVRVPRVVDHRPPATGILPPGVDPGGSTPGPPGAAPAVPPAGTAPPGTPPVQAGRRRPGRPVLLAAAVAGLLGVAAALAPFWPDIGSTDDSGSGTGSGFSSGSDVATGPVGQPLASAGTGYPAGVDPCLVGTWRTTVDEVDGTVDGDPVRYRGGEGAMTTFAADGSLSVDYTHRAHRLAQHDGVFWSDHVLGTATGSYHAEDAELIMRYTEVDAVIRLFRGDELQRESVPEFSAVPVQYRCTRDELFTFSTDGTFSTQMARVRPLSTPAHGPQA
ncbi:Hsp70 family protein [Solwaraspora sp. WMMA2101]|uniref:Hsp70 family protein n=1 Tax=Solwaraspora sp. WMMA2101 TaxID=3404124 RepID=UPI003B9390F5